MWPWPDLTAHDRCRALMPDTIGIADAVVVEEVTDGDFGDRAIEAEKYGCAIPLHLRANLLRWVTLTPDLGIEWRITTKWAVMVNGSYTSWCWDSKNRRYALWEVVPEVRRYLGPRNQWYVGAMFKAGSFNCKFSEIGKQGDILGGGITSGYMLPLGKRLSLDFGLGLGYIHAQYERYRLIDNVRVRQGNGSGNWYGPVSVGVTLVGNPF